MIVAAAQHQHREPHVALKPIVEAMGVTWQGHHDHVRRDPVLSEAISVTLMASSGGQHTTILPLKLLNASSSVSMPTG
ncbi:hypothetical protein DLJ53_17830 [Acuticoccus sediminis]|uniref:Antirepressor protein ant N-terminal domain-containing protein n=1 Tax=Acuticoccus sediminis TaxID=2184697 RepID=A0A8B2NN12_9HYPH|nr:phage antirepressor N-terminal domain-containing protein [Acuticoccus sediminis]RAI01076.1 hypothetical protein DLJ53_17830 [Acuticoccus sediminis]